MYVLCLTEQWCNDALAVNRVVHIDKELVQAMTIIFPKIVIVDSTAAACHKATSGNVSLRSIYF